MALTWVMTEQTAPARKEQNYVLYSVLGIILVILTGVKFDLYSDSLVWLVAFGRFGMPVFFIVSGYFLFSSDGHSERSVLRKAMHILLLTVFLKVLYLVLDLVYMAGGIVDLEYTVMAFVICEETTMHLWFVYALLLLYIWWWVMLRYDLDIRRISYTLSVIVLFLIILFGVVLRLIGVDEVMGVSSLYINEQLYPFIGIPFFTIGYYLHKNRDWFDRTFSTRALILITVVGMVTPIMASEWVPRSTLYVGSIAAAVGLFMLTFRVPQGRLRCGFTEYLGRDLKPFLYGFFPAVIFFLQHVAMVGFADNPWYVPVGSILAIVMNVLLSHLVYVLIKRIPHRDGSGAKAA